jgi:hypothetical protein
MGFYSGFLEVLRAHTSVVAINIEHAAQGARERGE